MGLGFRVRFRVDLGNYVDFLILKMTIFFIRIGFTGLRGLNCYFRGVFRGFRGLNFI